MVLYGRTRRLEDLEQAIRVYQAGGAAARRTAGGAELPGLNNLATADAPLRADRVGLRIWNRRFAYFSRPWSGRPQTRQNCPHDLNNLGGGLSDRYGQTGRLEHLEEARTAYLRACELGLVMTPEAAIASSQLGQLGPGAKGLEGSDRGVWEGVHGGRRAAKCSTPGTGKEAWLAKLKVCRDEPLTRWPGMDANGRPWCTGTRTSPPVGGGVGAYSTAIWSRSATRPWGRVSALSRGRGQVRNRSKRNPCATVPGVRPYQAIQRVSTARGIEADSRRAGRPRSRPLARSPGFEDFLVAPTWERIERAVMPKVPAVYLVTTPADSLALIVRRRENGTAAIERVTVYTPVAGWSSAKRTWTIC